MSGKRQLPESEADLDVAVERAIAQGHAVPAPLPYSCRALHEIRAEVRCSFASVRASVERLSRAGRIKPEPVTLQVWRVTSEVKP